LGTEGKTFPATIQKKPEAFRQVGVPRKGSRSKQREKMGKQKKTYVESKLARQNVQPPNAGAEKEGCNLQENCLKKKKS